MTHLICFIVWMVFEKYSFEHHKRLHQMADKSLSYCELECTMSSELCFQAFLISRPGLDLSYSVVILLPPVKQKLVFIFASEVSFCLYLHQSSWNVDTLFFSTNCEWKVSYIQELLFWIIKRLVISHTQTFQPILVDA